MDVRSITPSSAPKPARPAQASVAVPPGQDTGSKGLRASARAPDNSQARTKEAARLDFPSLQEPPDFLACDAHSNRAALFYLSQLVAEPTTPKASLVPGHLRRCFHGDNAELARFSNKEEKKPPDEWQKCAMAVSLSSPLAIDLRFRRLA